MIKSSYQLTRLFGIPIKLDISLIILLVLLILRYEDPVTGVLVGVALLVSITLHELGHSLVAMAFGCKVRDITLMMLGGCATMLSMPRKAWQEFLVAVAGPAVSFVLGVAGILLYFWPIGGDSVFMRQVNQFLFYNVGFLNIGLFLFNLLPAFPMDGGRVLRAFLQQFMSKLKATWVASRVGRAIAVLLVLSVVISFFTRMADSFMLIRLYIAYFIYKEAGREYLMVLAESQQSQRFGGHGPPDDNDVIVSPPPYGTKRQWSDIQRM